MYKRQEKGLERCRKAVAQNWDDLIAEGLATASNKDSAMALLDVYKRHVQTGIIFSRDGTRVREDGSLEMLLRYECPDPNADLTESRSMTLVLEDLKADGEVLVKGRWELPISLSATESQPPLVLENVTVPLTEDGVTRQVTYQNVEVTAPGVQLTCAPQDWKDALVFYDVALVLKDGSETVSYTHLHRAGAAHSHIGVFQVCRLPPVWLRGGTITTCKGESVP